MSLNQLTEYLLWKSIKQTPTCNKNTKTIKHEIVKQEIFDNDMICRVCTNPAQISITDKVDDTLIITAIRTVANISIKESDQYPKYVCDTCLDELKIAFKFKKKCEASDMMFRRAISSETILVTDTQPLVKHDFSLLLHQMKQNRIGKTVSVKHEETYFDYDELPSLSPDEATIFPAACETKKSNTSLFDTSIHSRIINILNNGTELNEDSTNKMDVDHTIKKKDVKLKHVHKCKRCDLKFETKAEFQKHKNENNCCHHPCPLCGKLVLNLAIHEKVVHKRTNKYTCHQCGKIYYSSGSLTNHMYKHKETKEYYCDHCPYTAKRKSYLVCHMRVHTGEHRYLCSICPLKFSNFSNLRKHQLIHFNKKFECSKCKRLFRQAKSLKEHFDSAHLNIRYRCSICGKDLSSRKKLLSHELRIHKREKHKLFEEVQRIVVGNEND